MSATRRNLLTSAAASVMLPGAVKAEGSGQAEHPDADLIHLCAEHVINLHAANASLIDADENPLWTAYERSRNAITEAKPRTLAGMQAKARAAKAEALTSRTDGRECPEGTPAEAWAWDLVNDLLAGRVGL